MGRAPRPHFRERGQVVLEWLCVMLCGVGARRHLRGGVPRPAQPDRLRGRAADREDLRRQRGLRQAGGAPAREPQAAPDALRRPRSLAHRGTRQAGASPKRVREHRSRGAGSGGTAEAGGPRRAAPDCDQPPSSLADGAGVRRARCHQDRRWRRRHRGGDRRKGVDQREKGDRRDHRPARLPLQSRRTKPSTSSSSRRGDLLKPSCGKTSSGASAHQHRLQVLPGGAITRSRLRVLGLVVWRGLLTRDGRSRGLGQF